MQVLAAFLLVTLASPATAQQRGIFVPHNGTPNPQGPALVEAFSRFCLDRFPGRPEDAAPGRVRELPPAQIRDHSHDDPSRAWVYRAPDSVVYTLTVEETPYRTCAVRRSYEVVPDYRPTWDTLIGAWAVPHGRGPLQDGPPLVTQRGLLRTEGRAQLLPGGGANGDMFMDVTTTYPDGHVEQLLARRAVAG